MGIRYAAKFTVHKGKMGAFQSSPMPATWTEDDKGNAKVTKEGAILVEMAKPKPDQKGDIIFYDWAPDKKVSFALGIPDIAQISEKTGTNFSLVHVNDNSGETKTMKFQPGEGQYEGTMRVSLFAKNKDGLEKSANIAFSGGEWIVFLTLLKASLPGLLGWDKI